jgi:hypothetical protein
MDWINTGGIETLFLMYSNVSTPPYWKDDHWALVMYAVISGNRGVSLQPLPSVQEYVTSLLDCRTRREDGEVVRLTLSDPHFLKFADYLRLQDAELYQSASSLFYPTMT